MNPLAANRLIGVWLGLLAACTHGEDLCQTGNRVALERADLKVALIGELSDAGVPFEENDIGEVCYPADKAEFVRNRIIALDLIQRPANEITVPGGEFGQRTLVLLDEAGIRYSHLISDGNLVLLVEKEDLEKVRAITYNVAQSMATGQ